MGHRPFYPYWAEIKRKSPEAFDDLAVQQQFIEARNALGKQVFWALPDDDDLDDNEELTNEPV